MIVSQQVADEDVESMLEFYRNHFDTIDLVKCEKCGAYLCFELTGPDAMGMATNEVGKIIVPIGDNMHGSRVRLDVDTHGMPMMGYQCANLIENKSYEQQLADWQAAKDKHRADFDADLSKYIAAHDKKTQPIRAKYNKAVSKVGPGEPLPDFPSADLPEYTPPVMEPFMLPPPQQFEPCGNDTRMATIERGLVPAGDTLVHLSPFEKHRIKQQIVEMANMPDFKEHGTTKIYETFSVERIK